jgi:hypothetical protein
LGKKSEIQLSLDYMHRLGWVCDRTEHWIPYSNRRKDLYGFGDWVAYHVGKKAFAIGQSTTTAHMSERRLKIFESPHFHDLKRSGVQIILHGWGKNGLREETL